MRQEGYQNERGIYRSLIIIRCKERHDQKQVTDRGEQKLRGVSREALELLDPFRSKKEERNVSITQRHEENIVEKLAELRFINKHPQQRLRVRK
jgi:hypothetical protein